MHLILNRITSSSLLLLFAIFFSLPIHALYIRQLPHAPNTKTPRAALLDWDDAPNLKRDPQPAPVLQDAKVETPTEANSTELTKRVPELVESFPENAVDRNINDHSKRSNADTAADPQSSVVSGMVKDMLSGADSGMSGGQDPKSTNGDATGLAGRSFASNTDGTAAEEPKGSGDDKSTDPSAADVSQLKIRQADSTSDPNQGGAINVDPSKSIATRSLSSPEDVPAAAKHAKRSEDTDEDPDPSIAAGPKKQIRQAADQTNTNTNANPPKKNPSAQVDPSYMNDGDSMSPDTGNTKRSLSTTSSLEHPAAAAANATVTDATEPAAHDLTPRQPEPEPNPLMQQRAEAEAAHAAEVEAREAALRAEADAARATAEWKAERVRREEARKDTPAAIWERQMAERAEWERVQGAIARISARRGRDITEVENDAEWERGGAGEQREGAPGTTTTTTTITPRDESTDDSSLTGSDALWRKALLRRLAILEGRPEE